MYFWLFFLFKGILDMGGASSQIAFQTSCKTDLNCKNSLTPNEKTKLFGVDYGIYTYSNLCFGNDDARRRYQYIVIMKTNNAKPNSNVVEDPCTHPGQLTRSITKTQLLEDVCTSNDKIKGELKFDNYTFEAKPDIKKCQEYTKLLVDQDFVREHFASNEINFRVSLINSVDVFF